MLDEIGDEIHHTWLGGDAEGWGGRSGDEDSDGQRRRLGMLLVGERRRRGGGAAVRAADDEGGEVGWGNFAGDEEEE